MLEYRFYRWEQGKALFECRDPDFDESWRISYRRFYINELIKNLLAYDNKNSITKAFIVALEKYDKGESNA